MKQLREATLETLGQVKQLILACSAENYKQPYEHAQSGVGRHVRHILDHFLAVKAGLPAGLIDYKSRHRDSAVESDRSVALQLVNDMMDWLASDDGIVDKSLTVQTEISVSETRNARTESTVSRELCYLINHTIHHVAFATLVAKHLGVALGDDLGVAPSTASYLRAQVVELDAQ
jgi:uncharacterized damage-inducible protein DinB